MIASVRPLSGAQEMFERPREGLVERLWLAGHCLMRCAYAALAAQGCDRQHATDPLLLFNPAHPRRQL
jgi:hypothetical protein